MEKVCKNCKYWDKDNPDDWEIERYEDATYKGTCNNPKFVYTGENQPIDRDGLGYWDYESHNAGFSTGEDFGCIHFGPKE